MEKSFQENAPELLPRIEGFREFEIYEFCERFINEEFRPDEELETRIREVAYLHGTKPKPGVYPVYVVELRDEFLRLKESIET